MTARQQVRRLSLSVGAQRTPIWLGHGALDAAAEDLRAWCAGSTLFVLSSPTIRRLQGHRLAELGLEPGCWVDLEVPDGEVAKSLATAGDLWRRMLEAGGKRDSRLIAFGGGSVGDLGGFVAGCFLRGIEVAQISTTLLGQVDAAIGGKTAIDLPEAKNSVGLFKHPAAVICDTAVLETLPPGEIRSGLAEVVKMAFTLDAPLFDRVEADLDLLLAGDGEALGPAVAGAAAAKVAVVEEDPEEHGRRQLLNFGHTLGHGLEAALGYQHLRHGEAVAYGMLFALSLAVERGLDPGAAERLRIVLSRFRLPPLPAVDAGGVLAAMGRDKKVRESGWVWVLPTALGEAASVPGIPRQEIEARLPAFLADPFAA